MKKLHIKNTFIILFVLFMTLLSGGGTKVFGNENRNQDYKIVGYYTAWSSYTGFTPEKLDANSLTHINYAFANIHNNKIISGYPDIDAENFKMLNDLKNVNPNLKILVSVGGWTWSDKFSDVALSESSRTEFANSCVDFIVKYNIDGIDLDWEYPVGGGLEGNKSRAEDKQNFTLLLENIREKLDELEKKNNRHYLLTIAGGASNYYLNNIELSKIEKYIDYANIMTYDIHGSWDKYSDFNSPLYSNNTVSPQYKWSIDDSANAWVKNGLPKSKIVLGLPFYGYIFSGVENINNGLYNSFTESKAVNFNIINEKYLKDKNFMRYFDDESMVPWLFDGYEFISYDDEYSTALKAEYIKSNEYGGAMLWELSYDTERALLNSVNSILRPENHNLLQGHWSEKTVNNLMQKGIIENTDSFNPESPITRGEFAGYIVRALGIESKNALNLNIFADVEASDEAARDIALSFESGIIMGYDDGTFRPNNYITRQEAMVMYSRAMDYAHINVITDDRIENYADKNEISPWAYNHVKKVISSKIFNGIDDMTILPSGIFKHSEAAEAVKNLINNIH